MYMFKKQVSLVFLILLALLYSAIASAMRTSFSSSLPDNGKPGWQVTNPTNLDFKFKILSVEPTMDHDDQLEFLVIEDDGRQSYIRAGEDIFLPAKKHIQIIITSEERQKQVTILNLSKEEKIGHNQEPQELPVQAETKKKAERGKKQLISITPSKSNGMYSKLVFTVDGKKIEFYSYELINIANDIVKSEAGEEVLIPYEGLYDELVRNKQAEIGKNLLIPIRISGLDNIKKWLFIAKQIKERQDNDSLRGWWIDIAGRLLLIKNQYTGYTLNMLPDTGESIEERKQEWRKGKDLTENFLLYKNGEEWFVFAINVDGKLVDHNVTAIVKDLEKDSNVSLSFDNFEPSFKKVLLEKILSDKCLDYRQLFYVSDHGFIKNIVEDTNKIVCTIPWTNVNFVKVVSIVNKRLSSLSSQQKIELKEALEKSIAEDPLTELKKWHPEMSEEELTAMQNSWIHDTEYRIHNWALFKETTRYIIQALAKKYCQLKLRDLEDFDNKLRRSELITHEVAEALIKLIVLVEVAKDVNKGIYGSLFRPIDSYGGRNKGDSYQKFAQSIRTYFAKSGHLTESELASEMRKILRGSEIDSDDLDFLPCLTIAWFISEAARNPLTIMTGLMLLDLMESRAFLNTGYADTNNNWYSWRHVLMHPQTGIRGDIDIIDVYGNTNYSANDFGGSHPMAHTGSYFQAKETPTPETLLNVVHQKEGHLIIHWLEHVINGLSKDEIRDLNLEAIQVKAEPMLDYQTYVTKIETLKTAINRKRQKRETAKGDVSKLNEEISELDTKIRRKIDGMNIDELTRTQATQARKEKELRKKSVVAESNEAEKLKEEVKDLNERIQYKKILIEKIIQPLLKRRISTLENLLKSPAQNNIRAEELLVILQQTQVAEIDINLIENRHISLKELSKALQQAKKKEPITIGQLREALKKAEEALQKVGKAAIEGEKNETTVPGWKFYSPPAESGDCFFAAVYDQLQRLGIDLQGIQEEVDPHNTLRLNIQGFTNFMPREWADYPEIVALIRGYNVVVAIYDIRSRNQWAGYTYHYEANGVINATRNIDELPQDIRNRIVRLAYTGDHYMSVHKEGPLPLKSLPSLANKPIDSDRANIEQITKTMDNIAIINKSFSDIGFDRSTVVFQIAGAVAEIIIKNIKKANPEEVQKVIDFLNIIAKHLNNANAICLSKPPSIETVELIKSEIKQAEAIANEALRIAREIEARKISIGEYANQTFSHDRDPDSGNGGNGKPIPDSQQITGDKSSQSAPSSTGDSKPAIRDQALSNQGHQSSNDSNSVLEKSDSAKKSVFGCSIDGNNNTIWGNGTLILPLPVQIEDTVKPTLPPPPPFRSFSEQLGEKIKEKLYSVPYKLVDPMATVAFFLSSHENLRLPFSGKFSYKPITWY